MKTHGAFRVAALAAVVLAVAAVSSAGEGAPVPAGWISGVGLSSLTDPGDAANEAAGKAKAALKGAPAKLVFVGAAEPQLTPELIVGVAKHFGVSSVFGCQITSPLTPESNFPDVKTIDIPVGVCVWALGGDIDVDIRWVKTNPDEDDSYFEAGEKLGEALRPFMEKSERPGKIIFTFGDQYNGANKDFAQGLNEGLGDIYPIVGAASGNITSKVIVKGGIRTGVNVGIAIAGQFSLGQSLNGGSHTPETADRTLAEAIAEGGGKKPFFALVFNCRRRRQGMIERNQLAEELDVIKKRLSGAEFFGFYGPGEIGSKKSGEPAEGVGFTVVTAMFFPE